MVGTRIVCVILALVCVVGCEDDEVLSNSPATVCCDRNDVVFNLQPFGAVVLDDVDIWASMSDNALSLYSCSQNRCDSHDLDLCCPLTLASGVSGGWFCEPADLTTDCGDFDSTQLVCKVSNSLCTTNGECDMVCSLDQQPCGPANACGSNTCQNFICAKTGRPCAVQSDCAQNECDLCNTTDTPKRFYSRNGTPVCAGSCPM
jgi:hypothetical protein